MRKLRNASRLAVAALAAVLIVSSKALAQLDRSPPPEVDARLVRRGAGARVGDWHVATPSNATSTFSNTLHYELYYQRGLDRHVALETSIAFWRRVTHQTQSLPPGAERIVRTSSYVLPLITALKLYPFTTAPTVFEPYIATGIGFALGIEHEAENAIGGGGTTVATGFGFKSAAGVEIWITRSVGILAGGRFQWVNYSKELGGDDTFKGTAAEGGLTYRFPF